MELTVQILLKNHNILPDETLESLLPLNSNIVVLCDVYNDDMQKRCDKFNANLKIIKSNNYTTARNNAISNSKTLWQMYISPGEVLGVGHEKIMHFVKGPPTNYKFFIFKNNIITKETRLWHKESTSGFVNPVFESVKAKKCKIISDVMILSKSQIELDMNVTESIQKWKIDKPMSPDPYYYESYVLLAKGKYNEFTVTAKNYLNQAPIEMASVMMRYYLSTVLGTVLKNIPEAVRHTLMCISEKPCMAEFWCLLGDLYYQRGLWNKAEAFYENAIILGHRRSQLDAWPIELDKYKEYPNKMITDCGLMESNKVYKG